MSHEYSPVKAGLTRTVALYEKRHQSGLKTQVSITDESDNLREDDPAFSINATLFPGDGTQEQLKNKHIDSCHDEDTARAHANEWMENHPTGLDDWDFE